ncbi:YfcC family protein [Spongiivirga citrea]|uniref:YfcC family protein n=1 Tax=Spongiivirga citrea TaxID=1481457 RepID=A0A6M0CM33_9FLAO|nr:YfcC family protein [Spongiivirga citrea]NER18995.1 YfcC family protein [Spongiivirga citrea]
MKKFPSAQTILLVISAFVAILTWLIPSGKYDSLLYNADEKVFVITGVDTTEKLPATQESLAKLDVKIPLQNFTSGAIYKPISIPDTYKSVDAEPQGFFEFVKAPIKGIIETADIIFLVLIIGGLVGIVEKTGAFSAGISWLSEFLKGREAILIISTTFLIGLAGTTFGFAEEAIAFLPILIPVFLAAKYDAMVAIASVFLGSQIGTMTSTTNPFATIIASDAAGIKWTSGLEGRIMMFVICITITIVFLLRYARKVRKDPTKSVVYDQREQLQQLFGTSNEGSTLKLTGKLRLILTVFTLSFVVMVIGVSALDWWFVEMTSLFLFSAIIVAIIYRMKESQFVKAFTKGAGELLGVAFIIGLARGISILMADGMISDTILFYASDLTNDMGKGLFINVLFGIYNVIAFFVSSTSGTAVLTMPIMAPLADTVGIGREHIVSAYQLGHGVFNIINPTALVLAFLGVGQLGYDKYLKFVFRLVVILALVCMVFLTISVY